MELVLPLEPRCGHMALVTHVFEKCGKVPSILIQ